MVNNFYLFIILFNHFLFQLVDYYIQIHFLVFVLLHIMVHNKEFNLNLIDILVNKTRIIRIIIVSFFKDADEFLAGIINGVQHADHILQHNR